MDVDTKKITPTELSPTRLSPIETPFTLREFGEIPKGFIPVYITIRRENLPFVAKHGLRVEDNKMSEWANILENIFKEVKQEMGVKSDRTKCIFAYPRPPDQIKFGLSFKEQDDVLIEAMINPEDCLVADGESYTEAASSSDFYTPGSDEYKQQARSWAKNYWEEAKPLKQYLEERHNGNEDDLFDFNFPEILIPEDIPTSRLKVVENYRNTKYD